MSVGDLADGVAVAFTRADQRSRDLAAALGIPAASILASSRGGGPAVARHVVDLARTILLLGRRRPRVVLVQAPPADALVAVLAYAAIARRRVIVDAHTGAFLAGRVSTVLLRLAARRAAVTLVATPALAGRVRGWGGRPVVLHEPAPAWTVTPARPLVGRARVVAIGQLAADEPVAELVAAARSLPTVDLMLLGDTRRLPAALRAALDGVACPGFLRGEAYAAEIAAADVIVALTDREEGVMRGACEAVWAGRPLVTSRTATAAVDFPQAVLVATNVTSIADGLAQAIERHGELVRAAPAARAVQEERARVALDAVRTTLLR